MLALYIFFGDLRKTITSHHKNLVWVVVLCQKAIVCLKNKNTTALQLFFGNGVKILMASYSRVVIENLNSSQMRVRPLCSTTTMKRWFRSPLAMSFIRFSVS